ncbi:unnamed protein product [Cercopithifilaria johnstoni]|uniref:Uncharacterized protein n=1 Tax=Cercopithifilaria johnstoni TaxID=2874296 RepID=A0A8J2LWV6_9BILA|nr:unnamed protein product [Cercopithifilaria johnstoni]
MRALSNHLVTPEPLQPLMLLQCSLVMQHMLPPPAHMPFNFSEVHRLPPTTLRKCGRSIWLLQQNSLTTESYVAARPPTAPHPITNSISKVRYVLQWLKMTQNKRCVLEMWLSNSIWAMHPSSVILSEQIPRVAVKTSELFLQ